MKTIILMVAVILSSSFSLIAQSTQKSTTDQMVAQNDKKYILADQYLTTESKKGSDSKMMTAEEVLVMRQTSALKIRKLLAQKVEYPSLAVENCIQGTVILEVTIGDLGKIQSFTILKSPHTLLDKEISRSMEKLKSNRIIKAPALDDFKVHVPFRFRLK